MNFRWIQNNQNLVPVDYFLAFKSSAILIILELVVSLKMNGKMEWIKDVKNSKNKMKLYFQAAQRCWRWDSPTSLGCLVKILAIGFIKYLHFGMTLSIYPYQKQG